MPAVQQRFPEGVVQFAEAAGQMDPEEFEALMLAAVMANEEAANNGGAMPGAMPGFANWDEEAPAPEEPVREEDNEEVESSDEEEEAVAVSALTLTLTL